MGKVSKEGNSYPVIDLREIEEAVLIEGQEWMRRRMEDKVREKMKDFSPCGGKKARLRSAAKIDA